MLYTRNSEKVNKDVIMQKKLTSLIAASVFSTGVVLSFPVLAADKEKNGFDVIYQSDNKEVNKEYLPFSSISTLTKNTMGFILDNAKVKKPSYVTLLPTFKKNVNTALQGIADKLLITIDTSTTTKGFTQGIIESPAVVVESNILGDFNWKGLVGAFNFTQDSHEINTKLKIKGISIVKDKSKYTEQSAGYIIVDYLAFDGSMNQQLIPLEGKMDFPSAKFAFPGEMKGELIGAKIHAVRNKSSAGVQLTNLQFQIDKIHANARDDGFSLKDFKFDFSNTEQKETIDTALSLAIAKLTLSKSILPIADPLNRTISYNSNININNIDALALLDLQTTLAELEEKNTAPNMLGAILFGKLIKLMPKFLAQSPEISISDIALNASQGKLNGEIQLTVDKSKSSNLETPEALIQALIGHAHFSIDEPLLILILSQNIYRETKNTVTDAENKAKQAAKQQIQQLVAQNLLAKKGSTYLLDAKLAKRELTINGKKMPLPF